MHDTIITLKEPNQDRLVELIGTIERVRIDPDIFEYSYIKLFNHPISYICEMQAAVTKGDRTSVDNVGDIDEIKRMRKIWDEYKLGKVKCSGLFVEPKLRHSAKY